MATVSTRLDDDLKIAAEKIANEIGIPLSTAINVFLKKFVATRGFPFQVTAPQESHRNQIIDKARLDEAVHLAATDAKYEKYLGSITYSDPKTKELITVEFGE